jgi:hypothetical protein
VSLRGAAPVCCGCTHCPAAWGGEANAEKLFEAFYRLDEALHLKQAVAPRYNFYAGVSMRHLTRPLVIRPDLLQPDEKSYYLPYVFNIHPSEAREDYIDVHGSRMTGPADDSGLAARLRQPLQPRRNLVAATRRGAEDVGMRSALDP